MAIEPAAESRIWAIVIGVSTPILMFIGMQAVIARGRDADAMAGAATILIACMIVLTGFRPGILVRDQLADDFLARPSTRYRIWASWAGIATGIALAAWYLIARGA